jgi:hypothetical protein
MDRARRGQPRYRVLSVKDVEVGMTDTLWTHGEPGVYRARCEAVAIEVVASTKTGRRYHRLTVRFALLDGPWRITRDRKPVCSGAPVTGRVVALWHELESVNGKPSLSRNAWFWPEVAQHLDGRHDLSQALQAWAKSVRWVRVSRSQVGSRLGPAKVTGASSAEHPPLEWLEPR